MSQRSTLLLSALALVALGGCSGEDQIDPKRTTQVGEPLVDIRADVNRNGSVDLDDPSEDDQEETWDASHGAIFLANLDDDSLRCPKGDAAKDLSDADLASCFDAADDVVDGPDDLEDMARLKTVPWPDAPNDALGSISVVNGADHVRLFKNDRGQFELLPPDGTLTPEELRTGVELAIEGKDIVRDKAVWDGFVDIRLHVDAGRLYGNALRDDVVRMRVAPLMFSHALQHAEEIFATDIGPDPDSTSFLSDLASATDVAQVPGGLDRVAPRDPDQWTQDWMEIGWMSMPAPNGAQHAIDVYVRSANVDDPSSDKPLRAAGRFVYESPDMHGKDAAGLTPDYDIDHSGDMDTLDSFGNLETIPPYASPTASYPMGRVIRGSTPDFHPDAVTQHMLDSQGYQPVLTLDTSWLWVGHIDETMSFVKMDNPRGWGVALSDPALAKKMLDDLVAQGNGDVPIFQGESVYQGQQLVSAETSAAKILADPDIMSANADAIVEIDAQSQVLRDEVGITDSDIVPVAFLFWNENGYAVAYQVGAVNGVYLSDTDFGAPAPHGPLIGGKDPFETQLEDAMKQHGITVHWIEDWWLYHSNNGEVHCGSNTRRALPATKWWEMGS